MEFFNKTIPYNSKRFNFDKLLEDLYQIELNQVHTLLKKEQELFKVVGKDTQSDIHKIFYDKMRSGWPEFLNLYNKFIEEVVFPYLGLDEALYQTWPTFRVQLPNNLAIVVKHYDSDELHKHPKGEINFILAITKMNETSTIWYESEPRLEDFKPMNLEKNTLFCFNGNKCDHFNKINVTGKSRISFDFRILPIDKIPEKYENSATTNKKFSEGSYYTRLKISDEKKPYVARDIWDKEKEKFNNTMIKYNVKDAWGVVDIFEKTIAEYAGSKYAVSVDCCTNALFLSLKYLKAEGPITIPSRTWISVPCTIIHAGCKVNFEDIEWSGAYQLKPYPVYDGAVRMKRGMYKKNTFHCLSFHIRKHLPIGKGGMILTDDKEAYDWFRTVRYEGRSISEDGVNYVPYIDDPIESMGWNMYMTPEQAARGLELFETKIKDDNPDQESSGTCKNLEELGIYNDISLIKKNREIISNIFKNNQHKRLYLGCNDKYINGFVNVDILKDTKADIISDVTELPEFDNNTIDLIYSSHMIEHVSRHSYKKVLKRWYDLIKHDGILRLALPDLEELSKYYVKNGNIDDVRGCMFGGQKNKYDYHYFGHDFTSLKKDLEEIGFENVKRFDWKELDYSIKDWSRDYLPKHYDNGEMIPDEEWYKGTLVSLNIECTKMIKNDDKFYYSYDYWFNNSEHDAWDQGYENYYVNTFYENIIMNLDIPKEGKILILGTHNCYTFDKLCKHFGYDRCIGYDLHNPKNHPNVIIKDCMKLSDEDKLDIAFCHNDLGNYATTPKLKEHAQKWAAKNIIKGGYMLSNNNFNRAKIKNIEIMKENGFEVTQLVDLQEKYELKELAEKEFERIEGYMIGVKI